LPLFYGCISFYKLMERSYVMKFSRCICLIALSLLLVPAFIHADEKETKPRNIILFGWDGAQRNHVKDCLDKGELPNLKKLSAQGSLVAIDVIRITDTKAGWSQILTGYEPELTGVFSNGNYQPIPQGYTVFERLEKFFGSDNIVTIAVIGKKGHVDADGPQKIKMEEEPKAAGKKNRNQGTKKGAQKLTPKKIKQQEGTIVEENGVKYRVIPGKPYYNMKSNMDLFINGLETNENVGNKAMELLEKYKDKPFFFFIHFAEVDHLGHKFGENSKEYTDALKSDDLWLGKIMEKLKALKLDDKTLVYVTADHGFDEGEKGHRDAPYVFLATNDPKVMRRGARADITPTILDRFGMDLGKIEPPLDGHPLTKPYTPPLWY